MRSTVLLKIWCRRLTEEKNGPLTKRLFMSDVSTLWLVEGVCTYLNIIGFFQLKSVWPIMSIFDIRETSKFKTRAKIQGVPIPYIVEDIGHPRGPNSIYRRGYWTSRGFFEIFQVFVRNLRARVILGLRHLGGLHFQKIDILNRAPRILTGKAHITRSIICFEKNFLV